MTTTPGAAWPPQTEDQLREAAKNKLLEESHTLDLKRELAKSESASREIAKDLAAFSVDGGIIIIGVDEETTPSPSLNPVELKGLGERIEQIGLSRVDEPVRVKTTDIQSDADPQRGYLIVHIPASPRAPHMADNRYYSRGDKTNIPLGNAEVMRWHERTLREQTDVLREAREQLEQLRGDTSRPMANLLIAAKPLAARQDVLMALSTSTSWRQDVAQLLYSASTTGQIPMSGLRNPTQIDRSPTGVAAVADSTKPTEAPGFRRAELDFSESGRLTLTSGGLVCALPGSTPVRYCIDEQLILGHANLIVRLAATVSDYGFTGSWQFVIATEAVNNTTSYTLSTSTTYDEHPAVYRAATYERATTATLAEVRESPNAVVRALVAPLLRSLGSDGQFPWLFS
jgi:Putative DNA-binding domain